MAMASRRNESVDIRALDCWRDIDRHFAAFVERAAGGSDEAVGLGALLASRRLADGDICIDLNAMAGVPLGDAVDDCSREAATVALPRAAAWVQALRSSPAVGKPGEFRPLVLDEAGRLYLHRLYEYERIIRERIAERLAAPPLDFDEGLLRAGLDRLFPAPAPEGLDWQRVAAASAVMRRLCVISGGPGTGKTATVVRILILLAEQARTSGNEFTVALAAPTGRAAARLRQSIRTWMETSGLSGEEREMLRSGATTLHRLLGLGGARPFDPARILPQQVVVVDEASMADCALMSHLLQAVPLESRLILLGDRDQLASVEAGAVLGDICDTGRAHGYSAAFAERIAPVIGRCAHDVPIAAEPPIADSIIILRKSYRFDESGGIGAVSRAVREGDAARALQLVDADGGRSVRFVTDERPSASSERFSLRIVEGLQPALVAPDPAAALDSLTRFAVLCALRRGPSGAEAVNRIIERVLAAQGLINPDGRWYVNRTLVVSRNSESAGLSNGDIGIVRERPGVPGEAAVYFSDGEGGTRAFPPLRLPEHETAFATTVHKAQGSEFDTVIVVLPERPTRVLTRELVYTALTRARTHVELWGDREVFAAAVGNPTRRMSGLHDALWG